ncbi:MAG: hypothetical protein LBS89_02485, partial [Zoogloeaceae bacterium]|jgi:hypothetical protein|nr:hypothetical protein [Zoogloeaceae bacterium]
VGDWKTAELHGEAMTGAEQKCKSVGETAESFRCQQETGVVFMRGKFRGLVQKCKTLAKMKK